jgi:NADP+-dependent farnesol dehydrogenase
LDVFINNAGIMKTFFVSDDEPENIRKVFEVNVVAACTCIKEAVKVIKETSGRGNVIVMNSILGHRIPDMPPNLPPPFGIYPATKHAISAVCQTLRQELNFTKTPIKVSCISPGMVETEMLTNFNQDLCAMLPKLTTIDVANAIKYVLSTPDHVNVSQYRILLFN